MALNEDKNEPEVKQIDFKDFVKNLPVGIYQVDNNGVLVYCNDSMPRIFGYSVIELLKMKIIDLYYNPEDREKLLKKMREEKVLLNETLHWKDKHGNKIYLSTSSNFVHDDKGNEIGTRGVFIQVWYEKVIDNMNEGIYRIGPDKETFVKANHVIAKMFGFTYPYEIENKSVKQFYRSPEGMAKFQDTLSKKGKVENYPVEMKKINGEEIVVSANTSIIYDENGKESGREGTLRDITEDYKIRKILEEMPTGAYQVKKKGDKQLISYCNNAFAQMFGYSTPEELIEKIDINALHASEDVEEKFINALVEADSKGEFLLNYKLSVKKKTGELFWTEIDCQLLKDHEGNIIGRQGTIRDATIKIQLEEMLRNKEDIQRFSHRFMAPIMSIKSSADTLVEEIQQWIEWKLVDGRKKIRNNLRGNPFTLLKTLKDLSIELAASLEDFIAMHEEGQNFLFELKEFILKLREFSNERRIDDIIELRETQRAVRACLMSLKAKSNFREEIRDILDHLGYLDKLYILYIAHTITDTSKIAYTDVENLRSYLSGWNQKSEDARYEFKKENLYDCIKEAVNIYQIYAFQKEIAIEIPVDMVLEIEMSKEDLIKMLHNLIQNAVKYSSKKQNIRIQVENLEKGVAIEIENYGVGILPEEIDTGKIFEWGYRGKLSSDLNRTGSGIGLPEAKKIARKHGGDIIVTSTPVGDVKGDPRVPYLTKVKVTLPKSQN